MAFQCAKTTTSKRRVVFFLRQGHCPTCQFSLTTPPATTTSGIGRSSATSSIDQIDTSAMTENFDEEMGEEEQQAEESSSNVGLIVGLVIASFLAVAIAWAAVWYFAIRKKSDEMDENGVTMADFSANSNRARYDEYSSEDSARYGQVEIGQKTSHYEKNGL